MIITEHTPVDIGNNLKVIFDDEIPDFAAHVEAKLRVAHAKRCLDNLNRRRGWRIAQMGGMLCDCQGEAQEAGWHACREWQRKHPDAAQRAAVVEDAQALALAVGIVFNVAEAK